MTSTEGGKGDVKKPVFAYVASDDRSAQCRATVAIRLPGGLWPKRRMLITAFDARTAYLVAFDSHCGVDLVDAVAASCSSSFADQITEFWHPRLLNLLM